LFDHGSRRVGIGCFRGGGGPPAWGCGCLGGGGLACRRNGIAKITRDDAEDAAGDVVVPGDKLVDDLARDGDDVCGRAHDLDGQGARVSADYAELTENGARVSQDVASVLGLDPSLRLALDQHKHRIGMIADPTNEITCTERHQRRPSGDAAECAKLELGKGGDGEEMGHDHDAVGARALSDAL